MSDEPLVSIAAQNQLAATLQAAWPMLEGDVRAAADEMARKGNKVLIIWPAQITLKEISGKFGFYILVANNQADELRRYLNKKSMKKCEVEYGRLGDVAVALVKLTDSKMHKAVLFPVYYPVAQEKVVKERGKESAYAFFRTFTDEIIGVVHLFNFDKFLPTEA